MDMTLSQLRFHLLPSANPPPHRRELHDRAYRLWTDVWTKTFNTLGIAPAGLRGEFVRQDLIACIALGDQPVAVHLYSFFSINSRAAREHAYFTDNYPELYFAALARAGVRTVMSMEYMTVHPEFRKGLSNVHLGVVLAGLALTTMKNFGADAGIAPARRDHKVHELAHAYGGESVIANVTNHNVTCDLIMCRPERLKPHESPEVQALVDSLWAGVDYIPSCELKPAADVLPLRPARKIA